MLTEHLNFSEENRNQDWDEKFFKLISESQLSILSEDPQQGPDGWPYLICETVDKIDSSKKIDSAQKIIHWLSTKGIGLVLNPKRLPYPDYVFSYGMLWSFRETGYFIKFQNIQTSKEFIVDSKAQVLFGPPSEEYLPKYVRQILKDFFRDQSVFNPKVLMIAPDGKNYDLCFSLESLGSPVETEHQGVLEALSWFLPPHYSIALVSEKGFPQFELL